MAGGAAGGTRARATSAAGRSHEAPGAPHGGVKQQVEASLDPGGDKPLCVPRQLAELLQLSVEEVCADFDAMLRHDWRRLGSAEEVREFCVTPG